ALDCYFIAPFLAVLGPTLLAVRAAMSLVGALYVAAMWWLGRLLFRSPRGGLLLAAVAAVFPLFAVDYAVKARAYGSLLLLEALLLALSVRVVWPNREPRRRAWLGADARGGRPGDYRGAADLRRGPNELLRRGNCAVAGGRPGPAGAGGSCVVDPPYGAGWTASWAPGTSRPRTPTRALERPRRDI